MKLKRKSVMKYKLMVLFVASMTLPFIAQALESENKNPKTYIVKEGDTLWQLAANLLEDPRLWPQLWVNLIQINQSTQNPHLIYPGDQLTLDWRQGKPQVSYKRKIRLSPNSITPQEKALPILIDASTSFAELLSKSIIVNSKQLQAMPKIVNINTTKSRFIKDDIFYSEGQFEANKKYGIYRLGNTFKDLLTGEALGTELLFIGHSIALNETDNRQENSNKKVTRHRFIKNTKEAREGDLIVPIIEDENAFNELVPQFVSHHIKGYIVAIAENQKEAAQWDVVIINKGKREQLTLGSIFSVVTSKPKQPIDEIIGELMVIKVYQKVSIAIVIHAKQTMRMENKIQGGLKKQ